MTTTTFNPKTGVFSSPVKPDEWDEYNAQVAEDPCFCPSAEAPHAHAPNAYPRRENGVTVWLGG